MIQIQPVKNCDLVQNVSVGNGHDCWGNQDFYYQKVVFINGIMKNVYDDMYIVHDGSKVIETIYGWQYNDTLKKYNFIN